MLDVDSHVSQYAYEDQRTASQMVLIFHLSFIRMRVNIAFAAVDLIYTFIYPANISYDLLDNMHRWRASSRLRSPLSLGRGVVAAAGKPQRRRRLKGSDAAGIGRGSGKHED
ncbi:hypothetical protein STEG23_017511 [Scotinomys teguina]